MKKTWYQKFVKQQPAKEGRIEEKPPKKKKPKKEKPKKIEKNKVKLNQPTETPRLNKYIANSGICSRRKADEHIAAGAVMVNDKVVLQMGYRVQQGDVVKFQGKIVKPVVEKVYFLLNKHPLVFLLIILNYATSPFPNLIFHRCTYFFNSQNDNVL